MSKSQKQGLLAVILIAAILIIDQWLKIEIKTTFTYSPQDVRTLIPGFLYLRLVENNGMAMGMSFIPKIVLTLFRIVACIAIGYYMGLVIKRGARWIYVILLAMVVAGAAGNLIDCICYGQIFTDSSIFEVARMVPWGEGSRPLMEGLVVDMFHMKFWDNDWFPFIFNFADASISVSVVALVIFCRKELAAVSN